MILDALTFAAISLGHLSLVILAINVVHGLGINWRGFELTARIGMVLAGLGSLGLGAAMLATDRGDWPASVRLYADACLVIGAVVLPATTIARALRGLPAGVIALPDDGEIDLAANEPGGAADLIGEGRHAGLLRWPGNGALRLKVERWGVEVAGLPPALEGLNLLHLTDLHFARGYRRRFFEAVVEEAMREEPDLVAFTGDLIDDDGASSWIVPVLSRCRGRLGQFAILGNHDVHHEPARLRDELARAGFEVVDGRWSRVADGEASLAIGGTSAPWGPELDPSSKPEADVCFVLSHSPDMFSRAPSWGADLVLAGHNHGGQIRLPVLGPILMPSRYGRRYDLGFFRKGRSLMYVSRGVGGKHPLRYGCPPEVTRLVLRAPKADPSRCLPPGSRGRRAGASSTSPSGNRERPGS